MCNPPFYSSLEEAEFEGQKKIKNLNESRKKKGHKELKSKTRNLSSFGGKNAELWCPGGELKFIKQMISESLTIKENCKLFSSLVSKKENLIELSKYIESTNLFKTKTIKMIHGKKISHILVWFLL
jgi:23S rRNA (adenine1618-N6)-methyltransferase